MTTTKELRFTSGLARTLKTEYDRIGGQPTIIDAFTTFVKFDDGENCAILSINGGVVDCDEYDPAEIDAEWDRLASDAGCPI
jgi:hypothetical protein